MEHVKLDPKIKKAMESFDWKKIKQKFQPNNTFESYDGILQQVKEF